jgi:hypothetical protein
VIVLRWVLTAIALVCVSASLCGCRENRVRQQRMEDVQALLQLHGRHEYTNTSISELMRLAAAKGIKIRNPIPRDPSKPCYEIVVSNDTNMVLSAVVIQETGNVADGKFIVKGYAGGYVTIDRKK